MKINIISMISVRIRSVFILRSTRPKYTTTTTSTSRISLHTYLRAILVESSSTAPHSTHHPPLTPRHLLLGFADGEDAPRSPRPRDAPGVLHLPVRQAPAGQVHLRRGLPAHHRPVPRPRRGPARHPPCRQGDRLLPGMDLAS